MQRTLPLIFFTMAILTACGSGAKSNQAGLSSQPVDPRMVPSATIPAALPSPIPAGPVSTVFAGAVGTAASSNTYVVKSGDTLATIASRLGFSVSDLTSANGGINPSSLRVGQELKLPAASAPTASATATGTPGISTTVRAGSSPTAGPLTARTTISGTAFPPSAAVPTSGPSASGGITGPQSYTVRSGDTGCKIAASFHVSLQELSEANGTNTAGLSALKVGQQLKIPAATGSPRGC
ncbi:MAG: LysM peptidoglycan-binding domain-containing protein [Dehalococcoidia bacterium]